MFRLGVVLLVGLCCPSSALLEVEVSDAEDAGKPLMWGAADLPPAAAAVRAHPPSYLQAIYEAMQLASSTTNLTAIPATFSTYFV